MNSRIQRILVLTAVVAIGFAGTAQASNWVANLNGTNEVPPNPSPGTGTFTAVLNDVTLIMTFQIDYQDLLGTTTASHIHRAPAGINGAVVYPLSAGPFPSGFQGQIMFAAADLPDLQNGNLYVNVHTTQFPGGEIRAQIQGGATAVESGTWGEIKQMFR